MHYPHTHTPHTQYSYLTVTKGRKHGFIILRRIFDLLPSDIVDLVVHIVPTYVCVGGGEREREREREKRGYGTIDYNLHKQTKIT